MKKASILMAFFILVPLSIRGIALQSGYDQFQKALVLERADGKLQEAIALYQKLVDKSGDKSLSAKAQLRIGMCYEKLGLREAQNAYQKVIDDYPQQSAEVAQAKERITRLAAASTKEAQNPTFKKLNFANRLAPDAQLSPDGKKVALVNGNRLWIVPMSSNLGPGYPGTPKLLDTQRIAPDFNGFCWSGDGQWIAFNDQGEKGSRQKIYIIPASGGNPRQIYENDRGPMVVNYRMSLSPDGKIIAFSSLDADGTHIYKMPVAGGVPQRLVNTHAREPVFSPDGKMIAYVEQKNLGAAGGNLWVVAANGGSPRLVAHAGNASTPVWSPDGKMLAFVDYDTSHKINIVRLEQEEKAGGEKISFDCPKEISQVRRLAGWTPENVIGAIAGTPIEYALFAQPLEGGKARFVTHGGLAGEPHWSPDGRRIYFVSKSAISYVPVEDGDVTTVPIQSETKMDIWAYGSGIRVSPDGKQIVFAGRKGQVFGNIMHIWTLPVAGGAPRQLTDKPVQDWYPCWSPDGRSIAFVRVTPSGSWDLIDQKANIFVMPSEGGEPRQITSASDRVFNASPVVWSPDGKLLAYFSRDKDDADTGMIKIIPANGGNPRVVTAVQHIYANKELAWSPDSKRIAFNAVRHETPKNIVSNSIKIVSLEDGSVKEIVPDLKDVREMYHLDWSPDGKTLVFGGYTGGPGPEFWTMENFLPLLNTGK
jgi:Tol biopolymer transport system component